LDANIQIVSQIMGVSKENMQNSGSLSKDKDKKREQVIKTLPFTILMPKSSSFFLPYPELLLKPLSNGCLIDMQEQVPLYVPYNLCRDVIG
jgi:hypothetical protein